MRPLEPAEDVHVHVSRARTRTRSAIALVAICLGVTAGAAPRTTAVGFDHGLHDRQLVVSGGDSLPCSRCHVLAKGLLVGKPDHATCFGACHGPAPVTPRRGARIAIDPDRLRLCTACHAEAALVAPFTGKLAVPYPPYLIDRDFNLQISHKQHAASACTECHAPPETRARPARPHARCASCHDGTRAAAMTRCEACHPAASGTPQPPELAVLRDTVAATFSHARHAARGGAGKACLTCHAAIRTTDDSELPRPTTATCGASGCHDGVAAFATTEACRRCHDVEPKRFTVWRPTARFTHGGPHAGAVHDQPCGACHPVAGNEVAVAGHAACARCHASDFSAREPKICGACHSSTEPWRALLPDRAPAERTEVGATLDHRKHPGACTGCHSLRTETTQLRPPRRHTACTTAGCHAAEGGPAPRLGDCQGCHRLGLAAARDAARAGDPWSVRDKFDHDAHRTGKDGKPVACIACHVDLGAPDVLQLATPPKATCAPCHDGRTAFKLTGTTCTRCHRGAKKSQ